jgi:hypothetical protein
MHAEEFLVRSCPESPFLVIPHVDHRDDLGDLHGREKWSASHCVSGVRPCRSARGAFDRSFAPHGKERPCGRGRERWPWPAPLRGRPRPGWAGRPHSTDEGGPGPHPLAPSRECRRGSSCHTEEEAASVEMDTASLSLCAVQVSCAPPSGAKRQSSTRAGDPSGTDGAVQRGMMQHRRGMGTWQGSSPPSPDQVPWAEGQPNGTKWNNGARDDIMGKLSQRNQPRGPTRPPILEAHHRSSARS